MSNHGNGEDPLIVHGPPTEAELREEQEEAYKRQQMAVNRGLLDANAKVARYTKYSVILAGITVAGIFIGTGISYLNAQAAKESARAAISAAQTAKKTLDLMTSSGEDTKAQIDRLIDQQERTANSAQLSLTQNREAMETSEKQSRAALDVSIATARNEQRPWAVFSPSIISVPDDATYDTPPTPLALIQELKVGQSIQGALAIENIGRSPAKKLIGHLVLAFALVPNTESIKLIGEHTFQLALNEETVQHRVPITVPPGGGCGVVSNILTKGLNQARANAIRNGTGALFLAGQIVYYSGEETTPHITEVCVLFSGSFASKDNPQTFQHCGIRSDMN